MTSLVLLVAALAVPAAVAIRLFASPLPHPLGRVVFYGGAAVVPASVIVVSLAGWLPVPWAVFLSTVGVMATIGGFVSLLLRRPHDDRARVEQRVDVVSYLLSSTAWFALLYWSGSAIEGFFFELTPALGEAMQPHCAPPNELFICNHLSFIQALHYSAANLITVGAAGITPLDDITRFFTLLQMIPTFIAAYVFVRSS